MQSSTAAVTECSGKKFKKGVDASLPLLYVGYRNRERDVMKIVAFLELGSINSGKGRKYLEIDYTLADWAVGNSMGMQARMQNDERVKAYKAQGYVGPVFITTFEENLNDEYMQVKADLERGGWLQSHEMELKQKFRVLSTAKELYDAGVVEV